MDSTIYIKLSFCRL